MTRQAFFRQVFLARAFLAGFSRLSLSSASASFAAAQTLVPPGNRSVEQPGVPGGSTKRTNAGGTTFDAKYLKVHALLENDAALRGKIVEAAGAYGIDPMHIVGAIVGEHTYNVDAYDRLQTYYVKAVAYLKTTSPSAYEGENIADFVAAAAILRMHLTPTATSSGPAASASGTFPSAARQSTARPFPTTASARSSSSPIMPARPSGSAS